MTESKIRPLAFTESFHFSCSQAVPCFNDCCRDLNQSLTPYDVLRLKNGLGLPSNLFLERFTTLHTGPESGLPVAAFKTDPMRGHACPFVSASGCRVYENRPSSCRMYPLARAVSRCRATGAVNQHFALLTESHCCGHYQKASQTVADWLKRQGLKPYIYHNDLLLALIHKKNKMKPGALDSGAQHRFQLALYDLDAFRERVFTKEFEPISIDPATFDQARTDDAALLQVGICWLMETVFNG